METEEREAEGLLEKGPEEEEQDSQVQQGPDQFHGEKV